MPTPPETPDIAVAWRDVRKTFPGGTVALGGVSLEVRRGEFLAILGTSGSGKTTLLRLINRLINPRSRSRPGLGGIVLWPSAQVSGDGIGCPLRFAIKHAVR